MRAPLILMLSFVCLFSVCPHRCRLFCAAVVVVAAAAVCVCVCMCHSCVHHVSLLSLFCVVVSSSITTIHCLCSVCVCVYCIY
jgi:hypothetical protein